MIFDTHAHYCDHQFDEDRESLICALKNNNIKYVTEVCASMDDVDRIVAFSNEHNFIYAALGVHPSEVGKLTESDMDYIKKLSVNNKVVAIGEIGLDYHYDDGPNSDMQKKWFVRQLNLARELKLPVIIHSREACKDTLDIMHNERAEEIGGVIHCFSYSPESCKEFLDMGFYIGIGGVVTYKNAKKVKDVVEMLPLDRLLLETDCPYLAPTPHRGERNSSLFLPEVVKEIASIKGKTEEEIMAITMENALKMYNIK